MQKQPNRSNRETRTNEHLRHARDYNQVLKQKNTNKIISITVVMEQLNKLFKRRAIFKWAYFKSLLIFAVKTSRESVDVSRVEGRKKTNSVILKVN